MAAVRDLVECLGELIERVGMQPAAHFRRRDRWPVLDRTAVAESEQSGAEAQPHRARQVPGPFGFVGFAFEGGRVLACGAGARRA
jgi:hypothetical protein